MNGIGSAQQSTEAAEVAASTGAGRSARTAPAGVPGQDGFSRAGLADEARLSTTGSMVAEALSGSDVRTGKVAALQQAIAAGTYQVSASDVADKVMSALLR